MNDFFRKEGYAVAKGALDKKVVQELKLEMEEVFRAYADDINSPIDQLLIKIFSSDIEGFIGCANACQHLLSLSELSSSKQIQEVLSEIGGIKKPVINTRPLVFFSCKNTAKSKVNWKIDPHQDWPSTQGSLNGVTCWLPLTDLSKGLGPLHVFPKSHLKGFREHVEVDGVPVLKQCDSESVEISLEVGDVLIFSYFTIHKSGENIFSDKIRWSTHFRYDDALEPSFIERKFPRYRKDIRIEGTLHPDYPSEQEFKDFLNSDYCENHFRSGK